MPRGVSRPADRDRCMSERWWRRICFGQKGGYIPQGRYLLLLFLVQVFPVQVRVRVRGCQVPVQECPVRVCQADKTPSSPPEGEHRHHFQYKAVPTRLHRDKAVGSGGSVDFRRDTTLQPDMAEKFHRDSAAGWTLTVGKCRLPHR